MEKIIIKNSKGRYFSLLIAAFGFVFAGIYLVINGKLAAVIGWVSLLFFGSGIPILLYQIFDNRPRLIIDDMGINDRKMGIGTIPWTEIVGATLKELEGNCFICLELKNPEIYRMKFSKISRALNATSIKFGFSEFNLNLSGVGEDPQQVLELIRRRSYAK